MGHQTQVFIYILLAEIMLIIYFVNGSCDIFPDSIPWLWNGMGLGGMVTELYSTMSLESGAILKAQYAALK